MATTSRQSNRRKPHQIQASQYKTITPQAGPQTTFLSTSADIAFYGGAAFAGKTFALLLEACRHLNLPNFGAVFFRRTMPQIAMKGGAWEKSLEIFPGLGGQPNWGDRKWYFPTGSTVEFKSIQHEKNMIDWGGAQMPTILVDEATTFAESMFWGLVGRNRDDSGTVDPYMRLGTNPDPDSWVKEFIDWWINPETGFPIEERGGRLRWFIRVNDTVIWADTPEELTIAHGEEFEPLSVTFVPASLADNVIGQTRDPNYAKRLNALPYHEKMRLLKGNWLIKLGSGMFRREFFGGRIIPASPPQCARVRYWDTAGTDAKDDNAASSAWTCGVRMAKDAGGAYYVEHVERFRLAGRARKQRMRETADLDKLTCGRVVQWQEIQGSGAGKEDGADFIRLMAGHECKTEHVTGDKILRAGPYAAQVEGRNVYLVSTTGNWIESYIRELEAFPKAKFKDQVDASSAAFNRLVDMSVHSQGTGIVDTGDVPAYIDQFPSGTFT